MPLTRRARRWLTVASVALALIAVAAWWVNRQLEPNRLTALVLDRAGKTLKLDIRFNGTPDYALKPEPRLLIPGLSVRGADGVEFLSAARAEISLPWSTIKGDAPVITRIELDHPRLDIAGLQRWMATRPDTPFEVPTLVDGIEVKQGSVIGDGYSFAALDATLPTLGDGQPAQLTARGQFIRGETRVQFNAALGIASAGLRSAFALQAKTQIERQHKPLKMDVDTKGRFAFDDALTTLTLDSVAVRADSPLPSFKGRAFVANAGRLAFNVDAVLNQWPADWPTLPAPLVSNTNGLPVQLKYRGASDLSAPLALLVKRDATELDATVRVPEFMAWMDADQAALLPPMTGTLRTPSLDFDGIELQGVELEISADAPAETGTAPAAKSGK
ncbi:MAG: hypothetical protein A3E01_01520 [Gammaproteobacteria bacterium RIFCSPHIGHO2_12_FULL_63_22]|nr:MAG: hypothetical protein A3E01_01520 [Gammaproteobacteria bacterium RIFCSPHIGHO2_12_FULL_63_22]